MSWPHAPIVFELDLDAVLAAPGARVPAGVAKFQPVQRDIAVVVADQVTHADLMAAVRAAPTARSAARRRSCSTCTGPRLRKDAASGQGSDRTQPGVASDAEQRRRNA